MSTNKPKSLADLTRDAQSPLGRLADRARSALDLAEYLRTGLQADIASHLTGCNLREDGTLVVLADGPAWAARLRFEAENLLSRCRERHAGTARVQVRVAHDTAPPGER